MPPGCRVALSLATEFRRRPVGSLADMSFLARQTVVAALTANAVRPVPGLPAAAPSMLGGWLTSELAPHLLTLAVADTLREVTVGARDRRGLAVAAAGIAGLSSVIVQSARAKTYVDRALVEALGPDYRDRLSAQHTDIDLSTPMRQLALPFGVHDEEVEVIHDVPYSEHGTRGLLDVYRSRHARPSGQARPTGRGAPVLLQVHGGAWTIGSKTGQGVPLMRHMAARGWVCVAPNYRLAPRHPFPAHLVDVKRAIAWVREHGPAYGADPDFVAITGGSAGGHLASLAALTPGDPEYQPGFEDADTTVQAAVPHYAVYDFAGVSGSRRVCQVRDRFLAPRVLLKDPRTEGSAFERASPLLRVTAQAPPFFVIHGRCDSLVGVEQARQFVRVLREVSRTTVGYAELPGTQHAFDVFPSIRSAHVVRGVDRFLRFTYDEWRDEIDQPASEGTAS
jgi:acetyl esterase/lipase